MVKGNWERRAELAAHRRLENREKKEKRKEKIATGESVRAKLLGPKFVSSSSNILVWCVSGEQHTVCSNWFRADSCTSKKCKLGGHSGASIAHLRDVVRGELPLETQCEQMCDPPVTLASLPARDSNLIRFIAIDNRCVFDYFFPEVWNSFMFECITLAMATSDIAADAVGDNKVQENVDTRSAAVRIGTTDGVLSSMFLRGRSRTISSDQNILLHTKLNAAQGEAAAAAAANTESSEYFSLVGSIAFINMWKSSACVYLMSFLHDKEMVHISMCSKDLRKQCLENSTFRHRKREFFSRVAGAYSKTKKAEQKKKKVQSHTKALSKKDEFARGRGRG